MLFNDLQVLKMLFVVVVTFALSWLPLYVLFCMIKFSLSRQWDETDSLIITLIPVTQWLGASNSCINPIIYAFFNRKFRAGFKAIITSKSCCGPLRYDRYNSCYANSYRGEDNRLKNVNVAAIKRERYTQRHFSSQSIDSMKNDMIRSRSVTIHNRDSYHIRQRKESVAMTEGVDMMRVNSQHKSEKVNGATKV